MKELAKIRFKVLKDGVKSIYLDINVNGSRSREFLKLYLYPGKDDLTKIKNKNAMEAAQVMQAKRTLQLQNDSAGIHTKDDVRVSEFIDKYIRTRNISEGYATTLQELSKKWVDYIGDTRLADITKEMLIGFPRWIQGQKSKLHCKRTDLLPTINKMMKAGKSQRDIAKFLGVSRSVIARVLKDSTSAPNICDNSANFWLVRMGTILNKAERERIIIANPYRQIDSSERPKTIESHREYLTMEELKLMLSTECRESTKNAFMFSCFTGLRLSDLETLTWDNISNGCITKRQVKTTDIVRVPLSDNAKTFLPERSGSEKVFDLIDRATLNTDIHKWAKKAGITKRVSFHTARHTFATLLLTSDVDLYTVSKLLGHKSIATTQIYADIIDKKRDEAVNMIPKI